MRREYSRTCRSLKLRGHYREVLNSGIKLVVSGAVVKSSKATFNDQREAQGLGAAKLTKLLTPLVASLPFTFVAVLNFHLVTGISGVSHTSSDVNYEVLCPTQSYLLKLLPEGSGPLTLVSADTKITRDG